MSRWLSSEVGIYKNLETGKKIGYYYLVVTVRGFSSLCFVVIWSIHLDNVGMCEKTYFSPFVKIGENSEKNPFWDLRNLWIMLLFSFRIVLFISFYS